VPSIRPPQHQKPQPHIDPLSDELFGRLIERLERIEAAVAELLRQRTAKEWYTVAALVGREPFTVREWCRHCRVAAEKRQSGHGSHPEWVISYAELQRYQRYGLRPLTQQGPPAAAPQPKTSATALALTSG
jgi:hypothetical protein